jgi:hypothetical protein
MAQRRIHYLRLNDPRTLSLIILLPSVDVEGICCDPRNIHALLRRSGHIVGYTMALFVQNTFDQLNLENTSIYAKSMLMGLDEINLQIKYLHYSLAQIRKTYLPNINVASESIIDLVDRTLVEAMRHMHPFTEGIESLARDAAWLPILRNQDDLPVPYVDVFESLDPEEEIRRLGGWLHDKYRDILRVARKLQTILTKFLDRAKTMDATPSFYYL